VHYVNKCMKPTLLALILCDAAVPGPQGKINLYGIFDRIYSKDFPTRQPQFVIYWKCFFHETGEVRITIYRPNGTALLYLDPVIVDKAPGISQGVHSITGVEFPEPGEYTVRLIYRGMEEVGSTTVTLEKRQF